MRRADRLFQIVNFLKSRRRAVTAKRIAQEFEICERTVYRDLKDLSNSGVPIFGEAGVGYLMDRSYHLPPLTFDIEEIEALVLGASIVASWTDKEFAKSAKRVIDKVKNALPENLKEKLEETALFSPPSSAKEHIKINFSEVRRAIRNKYRIKITYNSIAEQKTQRIIRPLALIFFGPTWLLVGWCELRNDFRNFRMDRILKNVILEQFEDQKGQQLKDYLQSMCESTEWME
jgi:predicted DNA-binding transcriptional regulator YafY